MKSAYAAFLEGAQSKVETVNYSQWPVWAKALSKLAKPEDKGIGDVTKRMIGDETSIAFKAWFKVTFGKDCGCAGRQREWNLKYPLGNDT